MRTLTMYGVLLGVCAACPTAAHAQDIVPPATPGGVIGSPIPGTQYAPGLGVSTTTTPGGYGGLRVLAPGQGTAPQSSTPGGLHILTAPPVGDTPNGVRVVGVLPGGGDTPPDGTVVAPPQVDPSLVPDMATVPPS